VAADQVYFYVGALEEVVRETKKILQRELEAARTQIAELEEALEEKPEYGLGKGNPAAARREVNHALLRRLRRRADSFEKALSRLNQGSYGVCERCGRPIHPERLAVLPDAKICVNCARGTVQERKKPEAVSLE
jgi:RNA polymerase-binding transcription factor DksA